MYKCNLVQVLALSFALLAAGCGGAPNQASPGAVTPIPPATPAVILVPTSTPLAAAQTATSYATATPQPSPTPPPTPTQVPTDTPEPQLSAATVAATATQATGQAGAPMEVVITEKQLNDTFQQALAEQPDSPIGSLQVRLVPDQMLFHATELLGVETLDLQMGMALKVQDGKVLPELTDVKFGGEEITGAMRAQVVSMLQPLLVDSWVENWPMDVQEVHITQGQIRMVGKRK